MPRQGLPDSSRVASEAGEPIGQRSSAVSHRRLAFARSFTLSLATPVSTMVDKPPAKARARAKRRHTRLGVFLSANRLKPSAVARECGYSRQHLLRLRYGMLEPTRK